MNKLKTNECFVIIQENYSPKKFEQNATFRQRTYDLVVRIKKYKNFFVCRSCINRQIKLLNNYNQLIKPELLTTSTVIPLGEFRGWNNVRTYITKKGYYSSTSGKQPCPDANGKIYFHKFDKYSVTPVDKHSITYMTKSRITPMEVSEFKYNKILGDKTIKNLQFLCLKNEISFDELKYVVKVLKYINNEYKKRYALLEKHIKEYIHEQKKRNKLEKDNFNKNNKTLNQKLQELIK